MLGGFALLLGAALAEGFALWQAGLRPTAHAHPAISWTLIAYQGFHVAVALLMAGYTQARAWAGILDGERRLVFDNTRLFFLYVCGQGAAGLALLHGFPWLL